MVALWGLRDSAHRRALSILDSRSYSAEAPQRLSALPTMADPFRWTGVVETETSLHVVSVSSLDADKPPEEIATFEKPQPSPALAAAMKTRSAAIFLDFARFPLAEVNESDEGYAVSINDLRFYNPGSQSRGFTLEVELDKNLQTRSENFYFTAPRDTLRGQGDSGSGR